MVTQLRPHGALTDQNRPRKSLKVMPSLKNIIIIDILFKKKKKKPRELFKSGGEMYLTVFHRRQSRVKSAK